MIFDLEKLLKVEDLSGYSYEGIVEGFFDSDMYSDEIKKKISRYEELVLGNTSSEEEKQEMIELRLYLKDLPEDLSKELVAKFREIELNRKTIEDVKLKTKASENIKHSSVNKALKTENKKSERVQKCD